MAKKKKTNSNRKPDTNKVAADTAVPSFDWLMLILSLAGLALTIGLGVVKITQSSLPYCEAGAGCDIVQSSRWSVLFGVPIALWGAAVYLAIGFFVVRARSQQKAWRWVVFYATIGVFVSLYLTAVSIFAIGATCAYCLVSLALMITLFSLAWARTRTTPLASWRLGSAFCGTFVIIFLHMHFSGVFMPSAGPEDPYLKSLAEHLSANGAKFYGAHWCPHCQLQKQVFGGSVDRLPYVECSPNGPNNPQSTECLAKEIRNYPTWDINGRRFERGMPPDLLAKYSGFEPPPGVEPPLTADDPL